MIKTFDTGKKKVALVVVPDDIHSYNFQSNKANQAYLSVWGNQLKSTVIDLPHSNYTIEGLVKDLSEAQWQRIIPNYKSSWGTSYFPEYPLEKIKGSKRTKAGFDLAKPAGHSMVEAATGFYVVNPLGEKASCIERGSISRKEQMDKNKELFEAWQSAQSKVRNILLLTDNN